MSTAAGTRNKSPTGVCSNREKAGLFSRSDDFPGDPAFKDYFLGPVQEEVSHMTFR